MEAANCIYESKRVDGKFKKPFFVNLLESDDLETYPQLLAVAQSAPMQEAAIGCLKTVPDLSGIGLFLSPANDSLEKSQQYLTDDIDKW